MKDPIRINRIGSLKYTLDIFHDKVVSIRSLDPSYNNLLRFHDLYLKVELNYKCSAVVIRSDSMRVINYGINDSYISTIILGVDSLMVYTE
jgi:hypothetical protein